MRSLTLFLILVTEISFAQNMNVQQLRSMYYKASQKSSEADKLYDVVKNAGENTPLLLGYKAMSEFMKCYHSLNPVNKLSYFYRAKANLDRAIALEPSNIELRYLRFTVQTNAPSFLNYRDSISDDKQALINYMKPDNTDPELLSMIRNYMKTCNRCTPQDKEFFKSINTEK